MLFHKSTTCCFSGYRPEKFDFPLHAPSPEYVRLLGYLNLYIIYSVEQGYTTFLCGMARGFDILCGEAVLQLKKRLDFGHIKLVAVIPYTEHSERWKEDWRLRHANLEVNADRIVYIQESYSHDCFLVRNRFMADNSGRLIAYYDGKSGGTAYTVSYCKEKGIEVINLAEKLKAARK